MKTFSLPNNLPELLGWIGAVAYLAAYFLLSINKLRSDRLLYHLLNILGAAGLTINAIYLKDNPNVVINVAWALIAFFAMTTISRRQRSR